MNNLSVDQVLFEALVLLKYLKH